jgi:hypothetical protein
VEMSAGVIRFTRMSIFFPHPYLQMIRQRCEVVVGADVVVICLDKN